MHIDCYLSQGCQSEEVLKKNIFAAIEREAIEVEVNFYRINDDEALLRGLSGSPSVFISGRELQPLATAGFS